MNTPSPTTPTSNAIGIANSVIDFIMSSPRDLKNSQAPDSDKAHTRHPLAFSSPPMAFLPYPSTKMLYNVNDDDDDDDSSVISSFGLSPIVSSLTTSPPSPRDGAICGVSNGIKKRSRDEDNNNEDSDQDYEFESRKRFMADENYRTPPPAPRHNPDTTHLFAPMPSLELDNSTVAPPSRRSPTTFEYDFVREFLSDDLICYETYESPLMTSAPVPPPRQMSPACEMFYS